MKSLQHRGSNQKLSGSKATQPLLQSGLEFGPRWRTSLAEKEQHGVALCNVELKIVDALKVVNAATAGMQAHDQIWWRVWKDCSPSPSGRALRRP